MIIPKTTHLVIGAEVRDLPVCWVDKTPDGNDVYISVLLLACDPKLTEAAGRALAEQMPKDVDIVVTPYGKGLGLFHVVLRETGLPGVLVSKKQTPYMSQPVCKTSGASITSGGSVFYLGADDAESLRGKKVAFVDDVVSRRGTLDPIAGMLKGIGVREIVVMAVATEGVRHSDVTALAHLDVFVA